LKHSSKPVKSQRDRKKYDFLRPPKPVLQTSAVEMDGVTSVLQTNNNDESLNSKKQISQRNRTQP